MGVSASSAGGVLFWDRIVRHARFVENTRITSDIGTRIRRYVSLKMVEARVGCAARASFLWHKPNSVPAFARWRSFISPGFPSAPHHFGDVFKASKYFGGVECL